MKVRKFKVGQKMTCLAPGIEKHFEVITFEQNIYLLKCVVTGGTRKVPPIELSNEQLWLLGWRRII